MLFTLFLMKSNKSHLKHSKPHVSQPINILQRIWAKKTSICVVGFILGMFFVSTRCFHVLELIDSRQVWEVPLVNPMERLLELKSELSSTQSDLKKIKFLRHYKHSEELKINSQEDKKSLFLTNGASLN